MTEDARLAKAGLAPGQLQRFMSAMERRGIQFHSVLMARRGETFFEKYWAPFDETKNHRMYSVTKSFVSVAIGCLIDEGKLRLTDRICDFFPDKLPPSVPALLQEQTIEDMLTMRTCMTDLNWFRPEVTDRLRFYFGSTPTKPAGTVFHYDSTGSYVLGCLVERLSGKNLLDYLREKVLNRLGGFESAQLLRTMDGTPWADSALLCTPRTLMRFAQLLLNEGEWNGEQLVSREYVRAAVSMQTDNSLTGGCGYDESGYGYQIWRVFGKAFALYGMGGQFAVCVPEKQFIFVCTGDNQLNAVENNHVLFDTLFDEIVDCLDGEEPDRSWDMDAPRALSVARGKKESSFAARINGTRFRMEQNPMGIRWLRVHWDAQGRGCLEWENAQGKKQLPFGMKENWIGPFPQAGYSDGQGNAHELTDFRYRCAASGGWVEETKLQIRVQVIDRYFGILVITLGFRPDGKLGVRMSKCAEDFFSEYEGWGAGCRE